MKPLPRTWLTVDEAKKIARVMLRSKRMNVEQRKAIKVLIERAGWTGMVCNSCGRTGEV